METIRNRMKKFFLYEDKVELWLDTPHPYLGGNSPRQLVEEGKEQVVLDFIHKTIGLY